MAESQRITVMVIEYHSTLRDGLAALLGREADIEAVYPASIGDALENVLSARPEVVLVDLTMPQGAGIDILQGVRQEQPEIAVVAIVTYEWDDLAGIATKTGASAVIAADQMRDELLPTIRRIVRRRRTRVSA